MASRNLPPSFFNANYHAKSPLPYTHTPTDLYSEAYTSGLHRLAAHATDSPDPWQYAAQVIITVKCEVFIALGNPAWVLSNISCY